MSDIQIENEDLDHQLAEHQSVDQENEQNSETFWVDQGEVQFIDSTKANNQDEHMIDSLYTIFHFKVNECVVWKSTLVTLESAAIALWDLKRRSKNLLRS